MKFKDIPAFKKKIEKDPLPLTLILSKSEHSSFLAAPFVIFTEENFSLERFRSEVETSSLFSNTRYVAIKNVDRLKTTFISHILAYLKNPHPAVHLLMTAETTTSIASLIKEIEKKGDILDLMAEKPWEKENQLIDRLIEEAKKEGINLSPQVAKKMVVGLGQDETLCVSELHKLICYIGENKQITNEDVDAICQKTANYTLWQWGEAIFRRHFPSSYTIGCNLLENDVSFFAMLSSLRNQVRKMIEMSILFQMEGPSALSSAYPYLKGGLLQKKIDEIKSYGLSRFKKTFVTLVSYELEAKNSSTDHAILLEELLVKICR